MKILVADDDSVSRLMVRAVVEGLGHDCVTAGDGEQAWQLVCDVDPDVVVSDWLMPGLDGLELCRRIRERNDGGYTYIVLVTSRVERDHVRAGMDAGADGYLTKPFDPFDLEASLISAERVTSLHCELQQYRTELARLACTDPLTQLRNRLVLDDDLATLHAQSRRYGRSYCVAMCDIDWFKPYNDTFGHQAGDDALRQVSAVLSGQVRETDTVYRFGGEEFLVALPDQASDAAAVAAERMRASVEDLGLPHGSTEFGVVTVSVGIAQVEPDRDRSAEDVLRRADAALYRAKAAGRNRVVQAEDPPL